MEAARELAERSQIPGVGEAIALVSILVNLVADSRSNAEGADTRLKQCRSIIRLLQRAERVLGKVKWCGSATWLYNVPSLVRVFYEKGHKYCSNYSSSIK